jgi:DNA mismatch repair protein MSH6
MFKKWICHPLQSVEAINYRLDATDDLCSISDITSAVKAEMKKLPDLERVIARFLYSNYQNSFGVM